MNKVIMVAIAVALVAGFYFLYERPDPNQNPNRISTGSEEGPGPTISSTTTPTEDKLAYKDEYRRVEQATVPPVSEWKTYTNSTHKYSVKYPPSWTMDESRANDLNNYDTGEINSPTLAISNGKITWSFVISPIMGGDGPACIDGCGMAKEQMKVSGLNVYRGLIWSAKTGEIVHGSVGRDTSARGFGSFDKDTGYMRAGDPIYGIWYENEKGWDTPDGTFEFNKNVQVLDQITQSLRFIK